MKPGDDPGSVEGETSPSAFWDGGTIPSLPWPRGGTVPSRDARGSRPEIRPSSDTQIGRVASQDLIKYMHWCTA